jgi:hypothetical protein
MKAGFVFFFPTEIATASFGFQFGLKKICGPSLKRGIASYFK